MFTMTLNQMATALVAVNAIVFAALVFYRRKWDPDDLYGFLPVIWVVAANAPIVALFGGMELMVGYLVAFTIPGLLGMVAYVTAAQIEQHKSKNRNFRND